MTGVIDEKNPNTVPVFELYPVNNGFFRNPVSVFLSLGLHPVARAVELVLGTCHPNTSTLFIKVVNISPVSSPSEPSDA